MSKRTEADTMLYKAFLSGQLLHGDSPVLREALDNANLERKDEHRLRLVKRRGELKIDAAVALSMAHHTLITDFPFNKATDGTGSRAATAADIAKALGQSSKPRRPILGMGVPKMIGVKYGK
jgi:phage terminase large subunit-like protein